MEIIENEYVKFWLENGILYSTFKEPMNLGLEEANRIIELRHAISNGEYQYWVMDLRNLRSLSNESHSYIGKKGHELIHASAVLVNSFVVKFLVEVFMRVHKPKVPMKIFTSEESAVLWLREIKTENEIFN